MVSTNETLRSLMRVAAVAELRIGREGREKFTGRNANSFVAAQVAEVHFAERVTLLMANAARHVATEKHLSRIVDAVDLVHQHEIPRALRKDNQLRPLRSGLTVGGGILVLVGRLHRHEIVAADDR